MTHHPEAAQQTIGAGALRGQQHPPPGWSTGPRRSPARYAARLALAVIATVGLVALCLAVGSLLTGQPRDPGGDTGAHAALGRLEPAGHFLLVVALVITLSHLAGRLAGRLRQPPVVGELATGLLLGPLALGELAPGASDWLFPPEVVDATGMAAQLGLIAFMFLMGTELHLGSLSGHGRRATSISLTGMAAPFLGGLLLAIPVYGQYSGDGAGFVPFALFLALALSITALPVLARILSDQRIVATPIGALALVCAATGDVCAWGVLALVLAFAGATGFAPVGLTVVLSIAFTAVMLLAVRPGLDRAVRRAARSRPALAGLLPLLLAGALLAAVTTQLIGIHAVFGAFVFGVVTPRHPALEHLWEQVRAFTMHVLLPLFFVQIGLKTTIDSAGSALGVWVLLLAVLAVAVVTKMAGVTGAARMTGMPWREAAGLGVLMNCRGLTELVVADIGYQLGVIDGTLFTVLVLMAAFTTALTSPVLAMFSRWLTTPATDPTLIPAPAPAERLGAAVPCPRCAAVA